MNLRTTTLRAERSSPPPRPDSPTEEAVFDRWARGGERALTANDWATIRNTMSTTTGAEGGYAVPSTVADRVFDLMKAHSAIRALATNARTTDGTALPFPTSDGTTEAGELLAQNATATAADPSFGTAAVTPYRFSSKVVAVPFELLQDAQPDLEQWLAMRLARRLARAANPYFTTGTGTNQPFGVVTRAAAGKVGTTGQTTTIIFDDLVDLMTSVDPAYRGPSCAWMCSDAMFKVLLKLKDSAGNPLLPPAAASAPRTLPAGLQGDLLEPIAPVSPCTILGFPVYLNNDMASPAANAKTLLFGDFSAYVVRDVVGRGMMSMSRFTDGAYTKLGQVGFLTWARTGGNLLDPNAVRYYQHSAT